MNRICALRRAIFAVIVVFIIGSVTSGCSKSANKKADVSANSFRADPSKMTPAEKEKFDALTHSAQSAEKK